MRLIGLLSVSTVLSFTIPLVADRPLGASEPIPLAYTQLSFRKGDLDHHCEQGITRAKAAGFNAIHLVPSFGWDEKSRRIHRDDVINPGEIFRCLEKAWSAGLHIIYKPHLENIHAMIGTEKMNWRASFDVAPDARYEAVMFSELFQFLEAKKDEIKASNRKIFISMTGELERSPTERPTEWQHLHSRLRARLQDLGIREKVKVGINPNGWPVHRHYRYHTDAYQRLLSSVDFVAPSVYEDWSRTERGVEQISEAMEEVQRRLFDDYKRGRPQSFAFGEFGVGGRFDKSHAYDAPPREGRRRDEYIAKRRALYFNLLSYLRNPSGTRPEYVAVWTLGGHDPVGVFELPGVLPDPAIASALNAYTMVNYPELLVAPRASRSQDPRCQAEPPIQVARASPP